MKSVLCGISALLVVLSISELALAAQLTSDYRDFENPFLITYKSGAWPVGGVTTLGPVTITNTTANGVICCAAYITGTPQDPSDVGGWGGTSIVLPMTMNFTPAVQAFGVTFDTGFNNYGSTLAVYDGPNGTGQLLGQIQSITIPPPWSTANQPIDFVGIIADTPLIRSARLFAQGSDYILIRAMALSIPEPAVFPTLVIASLMTLSLIADRKR